MVGMDLTAATMDENQKIRANSLKKLSPGLRFGPTDLELIIFLANLSSSKPTLSFPAITGDVDVYIHDPETLAANYEECDDAWYFVTRQRIKIRSNHIASEFWKNCIEERTIATSYENKAVIGRKRVLSYYAMGMKAGGWIMHEYRVEGKVDDDQMVLCKIFRKGQYVDPDDVNPED